MSPRPVPGPRRPGSGEHTQADQLEVPAQPCLRHSGVQDLERVVGPPLPPLTGVSIGETDKRVPVVSTSKPEAISNAVLVPDGASPSLVIGEVTEHGLVHGPQLNGNAVRDAGIHPEVTTGPFYRKLVRALTDPRPTSSGRRPLRCTSLQFQGHDRGMAERTVPDARARFADVVDSARLGHEPVYLTRRGHRIAAVIDAEDLDRCSR